MDKTYFDIILEGLSREETKKKQMVGYKKETDKLAIFLKVALESIMEQGFSRREAMEIIKLSITNSKNSD